VAAVLVDFRGFRHNVPVSIFWNKRVSSLSPYVPGEQPRTEGLIKLNTNENPYPPSPAVVEAIRSLVSGADAGASLRLYPDPVCAAFREAVALRYSVRPEQVFPGNGSDEVLAFAFGAFFENVPGLPAGENPPPALLFPDITYSFYPVYAGLWNLPFRTVPVGEDFSINPADYCVPSAGTVLPNPNAPTGRALPVGLSGESSGGLCSIVEYQLRHHRVVIIDEAYAAFGAESASSFIGRYPNLLTVHTLSKSASLAGLRVGFAIGSEELIEGLFRIRDSFNSYTMDRLALAGAAAAMADSSYYDEINKRVIATRERTAAVLASMGFEVIPSRANFLFIRWKDPGSSPVKNNGPLSGAALFRALRERGILVRHFDKPRIAGYLRVSIGTDPEMDSFLEACEEITGVKPGHADY
jgi:histidinol-phosphate aminotransferase